MSVVAAACDVRNATSPADVKSGRPHIDSHMMSKCLEHSIKNKVCSQIMAKLAGIRRDGQTQGAQTFNVKT
jgi:hypothetical protein